MACKIKCIQEEFKKGFSPQIIKSYSAKPVLLHIEMQIELLTGDFWLIGKRHSRAR
jgi:hypothetical protein